MLEEGLSALAERIELILSEAVDGEPSVSKGWAYAHLKRNSNVLRAIAAVSKLKLPAEVGALGRVLCEAAINLAWILQTQKAGEAKPHDNDSKVRESRAQALIDSALFERAKQARGWLDSHGYGLRTDVDEITRMETAARARRGRAGESENPSDSRVEQRAARAGLGPHYDLFYRTFCEAAHPTFESGVSAVRDYDESNHSKMLFMTIASSMLLVDVALQLLDRRPDIAPISAMLRIKTGLPFSDW